MKKQLGVLPIIMGIGGLIGAGVSLFGAIDGSNKQADALELQRQIAQKEAESRAKMNEIIKQAIPIVAVSALVITVIVIKNKNKKDV